MKKKIVVNERVTQSGECGCGHAAEDHSHEHESSAGHACCSDVADHANPAHGHEEGCCGGSHAPETRRNRDDLSSADKDKGPHP